MYFLTDEAYTVKKVLLCSQNCVRGSIGVIFFFFGGGLLVAISVQAISRQPRIKAFYLSNDINMLDRKQRRHYSKKKFYNVILVMIYFSLEWML